ncbi:MAG: hypothetical protein ABGY42_10160 [bacterium]
MSTESGVSTWVENPQRVGFSGQILKMGQSGKKLYLLQIGFG